MQNLGDNDDVRLAGELILAIADDDTAKATKLVLEMTARPFGTIGLIWQLTSVAVNCMEALDGEEWRDGLNLALLDISSDLGEAEAGA